jgi:hypothetical protein
LRSRRTGKAGLAVFTFETLQAPLTFGAGLARLTLKPAWPAFASRTLPSHGTRLTGQTALALQTSRAGWALETLRPSLAWFALGSAFTLDARLALNSLRPAFSLAASRPSFTLRNLQPSRALLAFNPVKLLRTWLAFALPAL